MSAREGVRAVLLDADGVLQQVAGGWEARFAALLDDAGAPDGALETFVAEAFELEAPSLRGEEEFSDVLAALVARHGWAVDAEDLMGVWLDIDVPAASLDLVRRLRATGLAVHLATNQHRRRAEVMRTRLGYDEQFDVSFYSWELGAKKPEAAYFERILSRLGVPPGSLLLVDDRPDNVAAARELGLRAEAWHLDEGCDVLEQRLAGHGVVLGSRS